jgi:hypothetical protein
VLDFAAFYPVQSPHWSTQFYEWMLREINDPLFAKHYAFLTMYTAVEAVYLVPHGIWCIRCLLRDDYLAPFHLLIWSGYMAQSAAVCAVEIWAVADWPVEAVQKSLPGYIVFTIVGGLNLAFARVLSEVYTCADRSRRHRHVCGQRRQGASYAPSAEAKGGLIGTAPSRLFPMVTWRIDDS